MFQKQSYHGEEQQHLTGETTIDKTGFNVSMTCMNLHTNATKFANSIIVHRCFTIQCVTFFNMCCNTMFILLAAFPTTLRAIIYFTALREKLTIFL